MPKEVVVFGDDYEIEELAEELFTIMSQLIKFQDLDKHMKFYAENKYNVFDVEIQKAMISLASCFVGYNLKRFNFLKTDKNVMEHISKSLDGLIVANGKIVNPMRDFRKKTNK
ncbi:hypothetical protein [Enterococcus italicus]|uniref:hypothetical protein n=1 Tax=Enterococcus italicus TaxID=246144 RepID=UPI0028AF447D|nr:hypothetical protein [Enterococcus italicus]